MLRGRGWNVVAPLAAPLALSTFVIAAVPATGAAVCLRLGGCGPERDLLEVDVQESRFSPAVMPRRKYAPAVFKSRAGISMSNGTHPSALREALLTVDKDVVVRTKGLPVCRGGGLQPPVRQPNALRRAEKACSESIVGRGRAGFSVRFPDREPIYVASRVTLFSVGIRKGAIMLRALAEIEVPVPRLLVATIAIRREPSRGWTARVRMPVIAAGSGSLTHVALNVGRRFTDHGMRKSFLLARCPDGKFKVSAKKLLFRNEANLPGVAPQTVLRGNLVVPCKPKG